MIMIRTLVPSLLVSTVLLGCSSNAGDPVPETDSAAAATNGVRVLSEARVIRGNPEPERRRLIADLLL